MGRRGHSEFRPELRIAIDTGGTFTDCVWIEGGALKTLKVFSTPDDPSRAIGEALRKIGKTTGVPTALILLHGTTVGTNALLQRKGGRVALITTAGFEDVIEIGRQARPRLYDFFFDRVTPLVERSMRLGLKERTDSDGRILERPSDAELTKLREALLKANADAIAISFLFSFANPENEAAVAAAVTQLGKPLSVSHRILPEFREYERTSTVVVNAYLQPLMQSYMERLAERAADYGHGSSAARKRSKPRIFVMQSSGGITVLDSAAREPVRTVLSGPAGGLVGAAATAERSGFRKILSFDMGGTSTDVAAVQGEIRTGSQSEVAGLPVGVPMLEIHTVGAGGGSLARFDAGGALRVGPESAGAAPGPICYGKGERPTVTDANLLLGRLPAEQFLGGSFQLDLPRTQKIVGQWLKQNGSRLSLEAFAAGVVRVVNASMEKAIRVVSIERGYDPREFSLVASGQAGAMHACDLAQALRIPQVIVPAYPGALSALGILISDVVKDHSRTVLLRVRALPVKKLAAIYAELRQIIGNELKKEDWQGRVVFEPACDLRYRGQGYELSLPFGNDLLERFHAEHERRYGYSSREREIEIVTVRLRGRVASLEKLSSMKTDQPAESLKSDLTHVVLDGKRLKTKILPRSSLRPGKRHRGPAIITEYSATTVVPPGFTYQADKVDNLLIGIG